MDRNSSSAARVKPGRETTSAPHQLILPSRARALGILEQAIVAGAGPVLLTGESGVGKSWICRRLMAIGPEGWRWMSIDVTPSLDAPCLFRMLCRRLGIGASVTLGNSSDWRALLDEALFEAHADGARWGLVVDEAQNASDALLEELRVLSNGLGQEGGLAGMLMVGQTSLLTRLALRPPSSLSSRFVARVHLRPLEVEELRLFLGHFGQLRERDLEAIEEVHRLVGGNPRQAFRHLRNEQPAARASATRDLPVGDLARPRQPEPRPAAMSHPMPPKDDLARAVPTRPPLSVGEGVVEVGWDGSGAGDEEIDSPATPTFAAPLAIEAQEPSPPRLTRGEALAEEPIDDRYAALQAWNEWERHQARASSAGTGVESSSPGESSGLDPTRESELATDAGGEEETEHAPMSGYVTLRAEEEHGFAPYSQLFSRLRPTKDLT